MSCSRKTIVVTAIPQKENTWIFVMAGQSNMAGRGIIEADDTATDKRILSIDKNGELIPAKEPLHFYEPALAGLDCGVSFAKTLLKSAPANISILMIPTAVGGSSISQWLGDSLYRGVKLYSNFLEKIALAKEHGVIKGIIWHQGESDTNLGAFRVYKQKTWFVIFKVQSRRRK
ncbi:MAG: sialate O-acetylesterase [Bacteroidia bacterium]|nr:sialate O-acetylesterase [Bacteroidia bacterium]